MRAGLLPDRNILPLSFRLQLIIMGSMGGGASWVLDWREYMG